MKLFWCVFVGCVCLFVMGAADTALAQTCGENVLDGDFENGCTNWDDADPGGSDCSVNTETFFGGSSSNNVGQVLGLPQNLDQNVTGLVVSQTYTLSFRAARRQSTPVGATVNVSFLGSNFPVTPNAADYVFTDYQFSVTASSTSDTLLFTPGTNMNSVEGILIDDVSVVVDCDDALSCTNDTCSVGICSNTLTSGCLIGGACIAETALNPSNDCEACLPGTSTSAYSPLSNGTACGDPTDNECANPDTCDGASTCLSNDETIGTACGDPTDNECANPDTCDGAGVCLANDELAGTVCGSPSDTECDNPDSCDAFGTCLDNYEMSGTSCGSSSDTECDNPDSCDGGGICLDNFETLGTSCGSSSDTECTDPDSCDGAGGCQGNHEINGTACGSPTDTVCTDPDSCQTGVCVSNHAVDGTSCDDSDLCTTADQCTLGACGSSTPVACSNPSFPACEPSTGNCEECSVNDDSLCTGMTPICDSLNNECRGCTGNGECQARFGGAYQCDTGSGECFTDLPIDGGVGDAGLTDGGSDAGFLVDAGIDEGDSGVIVTGSEGVAGGGGCDCSITQRTQTPLAVLWLLGSVALLVRRRRR